jgi:hypothetical protein
VRLADFFTLPALLMFVLGVLLSGWVMSATRTARGKVAG